MDERDTTRRGFLVSVGAAVAVSGAGCLGDGGEENSEGTGAPGIGGERNNTDSDTGTGESGTDGSQRDEESGETAETGDGEGKTETVAGDVDVVNETVGIYGNTVVGEVENTGSTPVVGSSIEVSAETLDDYFAESLVSGDTDLEGVYLEPGDRLPFDLSVGLDMEFEDAAREAEDRIRAASSRVEHAQRIAQYLDMGTRLSPGSGRETADSEGVRQTVSELNDSVEIRASVNENGYYIDRDADSDAEIRLSVANTSSKKIENFGILALVREAGEYPRVLDFTFMKRSLDPRESEVLSHTFNQRNTAVRQPEIRLTAYTDTQIGE
ncbi:MAG: hypothetical protein SV253_01020 [Halobacteria archaeon]|nr:hypothetical protein [Halobacteria archaeon]